MILRFNVIERNKASHRDSLFILYAPETQRFALQRAESHVMIEFTFSWETIMYFP